ncbi:CheR family methyltransferase [Lysobacter antibioticus]|uniref:CheR methyltransferase, SAM binding domain protein n=1 Tax=Lysobacter antibioticus TaxID=84531 RepID=A0A0S2F5S1_LYSAN|nr:protein-glutamate O-methyltransferase CheR [Lysobacter antibioticus]ALN78851.1 cheR methyltransferase, SAM binding domain protein [Lysobacter antibioticus]
MKPGGFQQWLKDTMGLDASTIGPTVVERAVASRMTACGCKQLAEYWQALRASPLEQQELIEAVVVPETWFFRDTQAFSALSETYGLHWAVTHPGDRLRLLSLPCSTGEEPYTMAMALQDAGFPLERLSIDAVDISERALAKARRGLYGSNSFRGRELQFRERHFTTVAGGWQLPETVRSRVNFIQGNVLDVAFLPGEAVYDAIFCRNLLIYFDADTQIRTVGILKRLLRPQGLLFVGPAEAGLILSQGFASAQLPMAFAFRPPRADSGVAVSAAMLATTASALAGAAAKATTVKAIAKPRPLARPAPSASPVPTVAESAEALLDAAQRLADNGDFDRAAGSCQAYLQAQGPSARALYLLGLIEGAKGRNELAEDYFRKALYLQPQHEETLMHLALLLETRGDAAGGRVLRLRAQRSRRTAG